MKKWLIGIVVFLASISFAILLFIPKKIKFSNVELVSANAEEAFRYFTEPQLRNQWISHITEVTKDSCFIFNKDSFIVVLTRPPATTVRWKHKNEWTSSRIVVVPQGNDSTIVIWESEMDGGNNPISRLRGYIAASSKQNDFSEILTSFASFIAITENVYMFPITVENVKDSTLIISKKMFKRYPTNEQIYLIINSLENYAIAGNAMLTNPPMLNIVPIDSSLFECIVAVPVNKSLKDSEAIHLSHLLHKKTLVQTVTGGPATIQYALGRLTDYLRQHKYVSPAIPYESLITNRIKMSDTSKWITKIYYPIL